MAFGGPGNKGSAGAATQFGARLNTANGVSNTLTLLPYAGNQILINGFTLTVPGAGLSRLITDHLISAVGADAGSAPVANTLYYVYVSNGQASFSPSTIRLSATAPSLVNGVYYLGNAGNALNWRFVGWVQPNATPQFESSLLNRTIINYYNRLNLPMFSCPNYSNTDTATIYTYSGGAYAPINGGTGDSLTFIANGEDAIESSVQISVDVAGICRFGIGVDSNTSCLVAEQIADTGGEFDSVGAVYSDALPSGFHTLYFNAYTQTPGDVIASLPFNGGANAPAASFITANIPG
jgi:hypothetical protein